MGKASRDKGARSERALRDELIRHGWTDVRRVPLSGAVKTSLAYQDDVVGYCPAGREYRFENKARATGFDQYYAFVPRGGSLSFSDPSTGEMAVVSLDPNAVIASGHVHLDISEFPNHARALKSLLKKCRDWLGNAHILSLKQDRMPFLYTRYRK